MMKLSKDDIRTYQNIINIGTKQEMFQFGILIGKLSILNKKLKDTSK